MRKTVGFLIVLLFVNLAIVATSTADQTSISHVAHLSAAHGPQITCTTSCHVDPYAGLFLDGQNLANTTLCDTCHSPGGVYDGVLTSGDYEGDEASSVGAKNHWELGVYDGAALKHGLEKWCVGCHDDSPSVINGVTAPNMAGDDTTYGYYQTGHGRELGDLQEISCLVCHDASVTHVDGDARTYDAVGLDNYQVGYRLKSVDGQEPMDIPRSSGPPADDFGLCFSCHDSTPFLTMDNTDTNFRSDVDDSCEVLDPAGGLVNKHWYHLQNIGPFWAWGYDSDFDGTQDSMPSCPACHNVHGPRLKDGPDISNVPAMIRTGELIGRESALNLDYLINSCPDHQTRSATNELSDSTGGAMKFQGPGRGSVAKNGVCLMCHNEYKPYWREPKEIISCSNCHNSGSHAAHLGVAYDPQACEACHDLTNVPYFKSGTDSNGDSNIDLSETDVCDICHQDPSNATGFKEGWYNPGFELDCNDCHELPPSTGTHLAHYNGTDDSLVYGDLRTTEDFTGGQVSSINMIGCGNCHPMDPAFHGNGTWGDVKLSNSAAPAGTLKALSASGSYEQTTGTCSNVYCHSANSWATDGDVPMPWPPLTVWDPASDPLPRPLPDNIITARVYKDVTWNSGETLTCSGCHDNPPQTFAANNDGGAGDSHYWVDEYGYENLHVYNMGYYPPIDCRTCHYNTVQDPSSWVFDSSIGRRRYYDVDLYDKAKHVNGSADIAFDTVNNYTYSSDYSGSKTYDLSVASFDPATKTCSNVGCHKTETEVIWGVPYRWYGPTAECNRCHGY